MGSEWLTILWRFWRDAWHIDPVEIFGSFFNIALFVGIWVTVAFVWWFSRSLRGNAKAFLFGAGNIEVGRGINEA